MPQSWSCRQPPGRCPCAGWSRHCWAWPTGRTLEQRWWCPHGCRRVERTACSTRQSPDLAHRPLTAASGWCCNTPFYLELCKGPSDQIMSLARTSRQKQSVCVTSPLLSAVVIVMTWPTHWPKSAKLDTVAGVRDSTEWINLPTNSLVHWCSPHRVN